jgi:aerobic-type carbon monoxide dehydrogenase small subunit (CoxS/CutS family)
METSDLNLRINGTDYSLQIAPAQTLLALLRDQLNLVGAKEGCGIGVCGACTVLVDGRAISSCLMLALRAEGRQITTIEGLAEEGELHPVQQAYLEHAGFQCAYCTPGFILSTVALLNEESNPDDQTIRDYLGGNLCRCGSYQNILEAVRSLRGRAIID